MKYEELVSIYKEKKSDLEETIIWGKEGLVSIKPI
jgi:hypothetical protein